MAVDDDMIHKNPVRNALSGDYGEAPKEKTVFTLEQQEKLLSFIQESNVYNVYLPMIKVMLETGLRCGELIGLTWADVDLENRKLSINHQLIYKDTKDGNGCSFHITKPKTKAGIRCIPMTETVYQAFIQQQKLNLILERHSKEKIDGYGNFIFLAKTGKPLMPSAINNVIYNMIDAYNKEELKLSKKEHRKAVLLPKISAHNMRHMACTNMAKQGMNIKVLQYIMGHAHSDVTMDVYNHIADFSDVQQEIYRYEKMVAVFEYTKIEKLV